VEASSYLESISVQQMLAMADEGSRVIHPRAIEASIKTKTPIVARNTFNNSIGTTIHHKEASEKEVVAIAHRDNMVLIEFALEHKASSHVDGVVYIDSRRLLLNDDVYLSDKLAQLEEKLGFYKLSRHWATISVVFNNKVSKKPADLDYAELLDSPKNIISYLLKETKVRETLKFLHGRYT